MLVNFRPNDFDQAKYELLPDLDQMRYDVNCLYQYLYLNHSRPFTHSWLLNGILKPKNDQLISKNRQISLAEMEYVVRGIYTLILAHVKLLSSPPEDIDDFELRTEAARSSFSDLADVLDAEVGMFIWSMHQQKFAILHPNLQGRMHYYPSDLLDAGYDLNAGLSRLYDFTLSARAKTPTPIQISYRNDGAGRGAIFDHATFQQITDRDTVILNGNLELLIENQLTHPDQPFLQYGVETSVAHYKRPLYLSELGLNARDEGMIVIPGLAEVNPEKMAKEKVANIENQNKLRADFEKELVADSLGNRTMLFICGGLYRLYEVLGEKIYKVEGHRGNMPSFKNQHLINNAAAHTILVAPNSKTAKLLGFDTQAKKIILNVTSVHQRAGMEPFSNKFYQNFAVVGKANDGVVEIVESTWKKSTAAGWQSHPESSGNTADGIRQKNMINELAAEADRKRQENVDRAKREHADAQDIFGGFENGELADIFDDLSTKHIEKYSWKNPNATDEKYDDDLSEDEEVVIDPISQKRLPPIVQLVTLYSAGLGAKKIVARLLDLGIVSIHVFDGQHRIEELQPDSFVVNDRKYKFQERSEADITQALEAMKFNPFPQASTSAKLLTQVMGVDLRQIILLPYFRNTVQPEEVFYPVVAGENVGVYLYPWLSSSSNELPKVPRLQFKKFATHGLLFGPSLRGLDDSGMSMQLFDPQLHIYPQQEICYITQSNDNPYEKFQMSQFKAVINLVIRCCAPGIEKEIDYHMPYYDDALHGIKMYLNKQMTFEALETFFEHIAIQKRHHSVLINQICEPHGIKVNFASPFDNIFTLNGDTKKDFIKSIYHAFPFLDEPVKMPTEQEFVQLCLKKLTTPNSRLKQSALWTEYSKMDCFSTVNMEDLLKLANTIMIAITADGMQDLEVCSIQSAHTKQAQVAYSDVNRINGLQNSSPLIVNFTLLDMPAYTPTNGFNGDARLATNADLYEYLPVIEQCLSDAQGRVAELGKLTSLESFPKISPIALQTNAPLTISGAHNSSSSNSTTQLSGGQQNLPTTVNSNSASTIYKY